MPVLALLRHGQASFGTDDYDLLSPLGARQVAVAGAALANRGLRTPVVTSGTLRRQVQTAAIAAEVLGAPVGATDPRLNEFDAHVLVAEHLGGREHLDGMSSAQFQVHLDEILMTWIDGDAPTWQAFRDGALDALCDLAAHLPKGTDAVVATSAGVTAAVVGALLGADAPGVIALNRVSVNASITTIVAGSRGLSVIGFNDQAHLHSVDGLLTHR